MDFWFWVTDVVFFESVLILVLLVFDGFKIKGRVRGRCRRFF